MGRLVLVSLLTIPILFTILLTADAQLGDRDGDGIPDGRDLCPTEPETFNGFEDEDGCPDELPKQLPPKVELEAEFIIRAVLVKWKLPLNATLDDEAYKWVLQRDINRTGFVDIANGERDPDNKPLEEGREVNYFLDTNIKRATTYTYKMTFVSVDGRDITVSEETTSITIPKDTGVVHKAEGKLLETTRVLTPKIPSNPITRTVFTPISIQSAYAADPLVTSTLNPKDEPYLFALSPIPNPNLDSECEEQLEIKYMRSEQDGQELFLFSTIIENQTIDRNQELHDSISNGITRVYQTWDTIPVEEKTIQSYSNLEVQIDIDSSDDLNPLNWRQLSIYEVNFFVPSGNGLC